MSTPPPPSSSLSSINLDQLHKHDDAHSHSSSSRAPKIAVQLDDDDEHDDEHDDVPPEFPSVNSAQRQISSSRNPASKPALLLPTVAPPSTVSNASLMAPRVSRTCSLRMACDVKNASGRNKVVLAPGCSALDWARLKNRVDLRGGVTSLLRVTPSELKRHNTVEDAWCSFYGKVYNITPYLRFHPGGRDELMRCAGRDGTRLFALTHSWVNIDSIIDTAMVGILTNE